MDFVTAICGHCFCPGLPRPLPKKPRAKLQKSPDCSDSCELTASSPRCQKRTDTKYPRKADKRSRLYSPRKTLASNNYSKLHEKNTSGNLRSTQRNQTL